jgi:ferritin-like metal-binding protein YciE
LRRKSNAELRKAIEKHLQQTERHVERLEQIFEQLGTAAKGKKCEGMKHLIDEGNDMIANAEDAATRDAVMIASAQKVEHDEAQAVPSTKPDRSGRRRPGLQPRP